MFKKRVLLTALILVLAMSLVAGCGLGGKKNANELLQDALVKSGDVKSAAIDGEISLNLDLSADMLAEMDASEKMVLDVLKNAKINYKGNYQLDPLQMELILSADIPFDGMKMHFDVPILINKDKMWVKIPSLPFPGFESFVGKFIELDFNEMAALSGEQIPNMSQSTAATTKFTKEVTPILIKHFDTNYFSTVDVKSLSLPDGVAAKNAVEFKITQDQLKAVITTFVEKVMPELFDLMAKPEYQELFGLTPAMVAEAKQELNVSAAELDEMMAEMNSVLSNFTISALFAIDKNGFIPQQKITISGVAKNPDEPGTVNFALNMTTNTKKINEQPQFENSFPPADTIPFQQLLMGSMMGFGDFYGDFDDFDFDDFDFDDFDFDDFDYDDQGDYDYGDDELDLLYEIMFAQPWFMQNEAAIDELYETDLEFALDLEDIDVIRALIYDDGYRAEFFAYYGIKLK